MSYTYNLIKWPILMIWHTPICDLATVITRMLKQDFSIRLFTGPYSVNTGGGANFFLNFYCRKSYKKYEIPHISHFAIKHHWNITWPIPLIKNTKCNSHKIKIYWIINSISDIIQYLSSYFIMIIVHTNCLDWQ